MTLTEIHFEDKTLFLNVKAVAQTLTTGFSVLVTHYSNLETYLLGKKPFENLRTLRGQPTNY